MIGYHLAFCTYDKIVAADNMFTAFFILIIPQNVFAFLITSLVLHTDLTLSTADMTMVNFSNTLERDSTCVYLRLSIDSIMLCLPS